MDTGGRFEGETDPIDVDCECIGLDDHCCRTLRDATQVDIMFNQAHAAVTRPATLIVVSNNIVVG
jgi:hypothetical protein